jgi:3-oxoadipate enol-lactonase
MQASHDLSWPTVLRTDPARFARYQARWACNTPWSFAAQGRMMSTVDLTPYYPKITARALICGAKYDSQRPIETARKVAAALPKARFLEVESGHFFALQTPELFVRTLREFIGG